VVKITFVLFKPIDEPLGFTLKIAPK